MLTQGEQDALASARIYAPEYRVAASVARSCGWEFDAKRWFEVAEEYERTIARLEARAREE